MICKSAWFVIFLMLSVAASPAAIVNIPSGTNTMPVHGGSDQAAGCDCQGSQQGSAATAPRGESLPRPSSGPEPVPASSPTAPLYSGIPESSGRVSGIRRIYPKNVLDHPDRAVIYETIVTHPGIDLAGIAGELGMNRETLRYHLDQLESATRVVVMRDHGIVRYYENHGRYTPMERKVLQHLWNPTAARILSLISSIPGITQAEVARHLAVTAPTVRWYMHRFRADGIITEQHEGKYTRYTLVPETTRHIIPHAEISPAAAAA